MVAVRPRPAALEPVKWSREELAERRAALRTALGRGLRPPPEELVSAWCERVVVLPRSVTSFPGPLSFDRTPYAREILDAWGDPEVEEITWVSSTQVAKTTVEICCLAAAAGYDPGPALSVQPNDDFARGFALERVIPVFRASPELARLLPKGRGLNASEIIMDLAVHNFASARSSADLASRAKRFLILGETDEYPPSTGKAGSPIAQAEERTRTFWNRKKYQSSTPKDVLAYIWQCWLRSNQHLYWVPCSHCGTSQPLYFAGQKDEGVPGPAGRIGWPRDDKGHATVSPDEIERNLLAWYECGACGAVIEEKDKLAMISAGRWRPTVPGRSRRHLGFHLWAAYSPWLTFSAIAAKHLREKDYPELVPVFVNKWLGRPSEERGEKPKVEEMLARRKTYAMGTVPEGVRFLTAAVDVHKAWQYWMVWGWGMGFTGWLVAAGREDTAVSADSGWERLFAALAGRFPPTDPAAGSSAAGAEAGLVVGLPAGVVLVDAGWDKPEDPDELVDEWEVYQRCDQWNLRVGGPLFQPSKGGSHAGMFPPLAFHRSLDRDRDGKPLKGRLQLHVFNPWFFKKSFYSRFSRTGEVGGFWLPGNLPRAVSEQLLAEEMVTHQDGREEWHRRGANHWFDCAILCLAGAWKYRQYLEAPPPAAGPAAKPEAGPDPEGPRPGALSGTPLRLPERRLTP